MAEAARSARDGQKLPRKFAKLSQPQNQRKATRTTDDGQAPRLSPTSHHTIAETPHQQCTSTSTARTARTATTTTTTINDHQPPVTSPLWRALNRSSFSFDVKSSS